MTQILLILDGTSESDKQYILEIDIIVMIPIIIMMTNAEQHIGLDFIILIIQVIMQVIINGLIFIMKIKLVQIIIQIGIKKVNLFIMKNKVI